MFCLTKVQGIFIAENNEKIFREFTQELINWGKNGEAPDIASLDLKYAMDLQQKRLKANGVTVDYKFKSRGEWLDNVHSFGGRQDSGNFKSVTSDSHFKLTKTFYKNGRKSQKRKKNSIFYTMITTLLNQDADATCCCPNCGAISSIKELLGGCPHCKTRFIMNDLYPKVTNFYFVDDYAENNSSMRNRLLPWVLIPAAALAVYFGFVNYESLEIVAYIISLIAAAIGGAIGGYMLWAFLFLAKLIVKSFASIPSMGKVIAVKRNLPKYMKQIDSNFSYEYFIGKVFALIKMMVFSEDYTNLAVYEGKPMQNPFKDIVDIEFTGIIRLNSFNINGSYCYVDMNFHTVDFVAKNGSVCKKNDVFHIKVCRNIHTLQNPNFSLKRVECKSCGASFDATRERNCPYCSNPYHLGDDDWVVLEFGKA